MTLTFSFYQDSDEIEWDKFILEKSMNGTFLQTRKFINYHPKDRFVDASICIRKIAGSMLFYFNNDIVHTQYLSSDEEYLSMFPMDFLIYNLINVGIQKNKKIFSFGICTEDRGRYLNLGLSRFKEGFGTEFCVNRSYEKSLNSFKTNM